jgi:hypothetical protein
MRTDLPARTLPVLLSPEFRLLVLVALVANVFAIGMLLYAAVRRRGRQPVPAWVTYGGFVAFGLGSSTFPIGWSYDPAYLLGFIAVPLITAGVLAYTRRFRIAGALLLGLAGPSLLWWGWFIAADVLDPDIRYQLVLIGWFAQSLFVAALGLIGVVIGNRVRTAPPPSRDGPPESRVMVIARAFQREIGFGPVTYPEALAAPVALLVLIGVTAAADQLSLSPLIGLLVSVPLAALVGTEIWFWILSPQLRHAMEGFSVLGHWEVLRWKRTASRSVPSSAAAAHHWLIEHPETPQSRWARVELLFWTGQFEEAREVLGRLPDDTEQDRFDRVVQSTFVDWVLNGEISLADLRAAAATFGKAGSDEARIARAHVAYAEAQRAEASGGDWTEPLIAFRNSVEPQHRAWHRDLWLARFRTYLLLIGALGVAVVALGGQPLL